MRILRVIPSMDPKKGGPSQGIRYTSNFFSEIGIITEVVSLDHIKSNFENSSTFTLHRLGTGITAWGIHFGYSKWLKTNIGRFDVVIIHGLWSYIAFETFKVYYSCKKKHKSLKQALPSIFLMPHGMLDPYFQLAPDRWLKSIRNQFFWWAFDSKIVNGVDGILFTCEEELLLARKSFSNYHPKREFNVGYGISVPPIFSKSMRKCLYSSFPYLYDRKFLLFLGRIDKKKGIDSLINAYLKLKESIPDLPTLIIAGPGVETKFGKYLQDLAKASAAIHFVGMVNGKMKWALLQKCEALILPSHQENFGIVVAEALACRTPVLISNKVNIWREIQHFDAGIISSDTEQGTLELLTMWYSTSDLEIKNMKENALNCYLKNFTISDFSNRILKVVNFELKA